MGNKQRILITGADGFIGRHLTEEYAKNGFKVYANVLKKNPITQIMEQYENVMVVESSIRDIAKHIHEDVDVLYHLAWMGVNANDRNNLTLQMKNIELSIQCVVEAKKLGVKKIIFPGSTSEYLYEEDKIGNNPKPNPKNAYGSVKVAVRFLAKQLCKEEQIDFVYPIITGIYAADRKDNNVIFYTIRELLNNRVPKLSSCEQRWNYVHIEDAVRALFLLGVKKLSGEVYPIGSNENCLLKDYIMTIKKCIGSNIDISFGEKNEEAGASCIDLTYISADTGFFPEIPFSSGIKDVISNIAEEYM